MTHNKAPHSTDKTTDAELVPNAQARIPLERGEFTMNLYKDPENGKEHLAMLLGNITEENTLVRIHSECLTGDVFGSLRCDCGPQLKNSMDEIAKEGTGILIYLRQEGRGIGLTEKLRAYELQDQGYDTVEANLMLGHGADERDFKIAGDILKSLSVTSIRIITNNQNKINAIEKSGIKVNKRMVSPLAVNKENLDYLKIKAAKMNHLYKAQDLC